MNDNNFNRAVDFLQGALNAATFSAGSQDDSPSQQTESPTSAPSSDLLPGFEPSPERLPEKTDADSAEAPERETVEAPPSPPPVIHFKAEKSTSLELHPPAKKRSGLAAQAGLSATDAGGRASFRPNMTVAFAALSGVLGVGLIVALAFLAHSPEAPLEEPASDIPLALLPDTADPALWATVSKMSGEIDGAFLSFERGLATDADGRVYRLLLDFCRNGSDIYAKVAGDRTYVVRLDGRGKITKAYPAPKNRKPLMEIFGK